MSEPNDLQRIHDGMTPDEINVVRIEIEGELLQIKSKLDEARSRAWTHDEYADPEWFRKAQAAVRFKQFALRQIAEKVRLAREQGKPICEFFVDVARDQLEQQDFDEIMEDARAMRDQSTAKARGATP